MGKMFDSCVMKLTVMMGVVMVMVMMVIVGKMVDEECDEDGGGLKEMKGFGGNDESKKMQRNVLKHQFENFTTAPNECLDKAYDRFQKLISQLEVHGALVSKEDINQKFLRSLPPLWSHIALIMRNKPDIDQTDIDDLYNNLRVYEDEMKRSSSSTSNSQNLGLKELIMCGDIVKDSNSYLKSRGSIEDFVSFREMITSQLQGKLWLYDEVRMRLCLFCHHQIGEDCWDS
ncbi:hypothetical protein Tco_0661024 [Tanacetum coccineum]